MTQLLKNTVRNNATFESKCNIKIVVRAYNVVQNIAMYVNCQYLSNIFFSPYLSIFWPFLPCHLFIQVAINHQVSFINNTFSIIITTFISVKRDIYEHIFALSQLCCLTFYSFILSGILDT